ncbi:hypothetical protein GCM10023334_103320 [Nonomuraea thailandensis]
MRDLVETGLDVAFHDPLIGAGGEMADLGHRIMGPAVRAKPVGTREKSASKIGSNTSFKDA